MLRAFYLLRDSIGKISRIGKTMTINSDLDVIKNRLIYERRNASVYFNELLNVVDCDLYIVEEAHNEFNTIMEDLLQEEDNAVIKQELTTLPQVILTGGMENINEYDLSRRAKMYEHDYDNANLIDDMDLRTLSRCFSTETNRPVNFLDARCYNGYNANEIMKMSLEDLKLYGMEFDNTRANYAKDKGCFTKIAKGGLKGSKCSNNVFDVVLLTPTTKFVAEFTPMQTLKPRIEFEELKQVTNYLRDDGLLLMPIPYYRLTAQMITYISKNYKDVSVTKISNTWNQLVVVAGLKKPSDDGDEDVYNLLRRISLDSSVANDKQLNKYILPATLLSVDLFRGNILDDEDIEYISNCTGLYDNFMDKQKHILDSLDKQQPLLPFNIGQIGLVLTSGCLDGEIEELEGHYHVIKGMVRKEEIVEIVEGETKGQKETRTTFVNKVQINVVAPDGTFKTLA